MAPKFQTAIGKPRGFSRFRCYPNKSPGAALQRNSATCLAVDADSKFLHTHFIDRAFTRNFLQRFNCLICYCFLLCRRIGVPTKLVHERYDAERVGSSTMPHKRNPSNFEFVKSMWKAMMPRMMTLYMDQISEHQRDLTNSASARFITELFTAFIYAISRLTDAMKRLEVDQDAMSAQLKGTKFEAILAEPLYILLTAQGHPDGYGGARKVVDQARATGEPISKLMWADETLTPYLKNLSAKQRELFENPQRYIGAAVQQTHATCDEWAARCQRLTQQLNDESKASQ